MNTFNLNDFQRNPDGSYSKKITIPQPQTLIRNVEYKNAKGNIIAIQNEITSIEFESGLPPKKKKKKEIPVYFNGMDVQDVYENGEKEGFIFLKGQCPSSKNSKQLFKNKKTGKTFITSSNLCKEYVKETEIHYKLFASKFHELIKGKDKPYRIEFTFIRNSRRKSDFHNLVQLPLDLMQHYGWIKGDDMDEILPFPGNPAYGYDPKLAGIIIKILNNYE